jgi:SAM-dependent methyltransferase
MPGAAARRTGERTVAAFGEQWSHYTQNDGYYGSLELFADVIAPLLTPADFTGARVADIGSGTGRIVGMLLAAGAAHVTAVEPSRAFAVLSRNTADIRDRVTVLNVTGDRLPPGLELDYVVSLGVLHHIPEPAPVVRAALAALRPGGRILLWVYAHEGNERYLAWTTPLRALTTRMPHLAVAGVSHLLASATTAFLAAKAAVRPGGSGYLDRVFARLPYRDRHLVVYDQLRPRHTKHYTAHELEELLSSCGYAEIHLSHRHGYSWTAVATKPA